MFEVFGVGGWIVRDTVNIIIADKAKFSLGSFSKPAILQILYYTEAYPFQFKQMCFLRSEYFFRIATYSY